MIMKHKNNTNLLMNGHCLVLGLLTLLICTFLGAPISAADEEFPIVVIETNKGNIVMQIYPYLAPQNTSAFLNLVNHGFYNGKFFHRVENWVIQGGDPLGNGSGNYIDANGQARFLPLEASPRASHKFAGVVGMARGSNPNSASCQFYITKSPALSLDRQYTIIGKVIQGLDVVGRIRIGDTMNSVYIASQNNDQNNNNSPRQPQQQPAAQPDIEPYEDSGF
jgi:cyclophilin family peptidyl-prolyl cis-trans isomerase